MIDGIRSGEVTRRRGRRRACARLPFADLGDALVDHHRALRQGMPEAVYGPGKTRRAVRAHRRRAARARQRSGAADAGRRRAGQGGRRRSTAQATSPADACCGASPAERRTHRVLIATRRHGRYARRRRGGDHARAPTASTPTACTTSASPGCTACSPTSIASPAADAVIVVAGMEGALASVIGGLTAAPVVAVPTSVGYGAALDGVTALLAMHASCASGVTVVGIDNGFGAAVRRGADAAAMTGRTVWFNCCAGVAGDMLLASLVDAGADANAVADGLAKLGVDGYAVDVRACPALRRRRDAGRTSPSNDAATRPRRSRRRVTQHAHRPAARRARADRRV